MSTDTSIPELDLIYRHAPVGLCVLDRELRWVRINERLAGMNGFPVEAHIGRRVRDLLPDLARKTEPLMRRVLRTGRPVLNIEIRDRKAHPPNEPRTWLASWHPLRNAAGRIEGINIVAEEITGRNCADLARREAEARLELAMKASAAGAWSWDALTNQSSWDDRYHAMYGLGAKDPRTFETWIGRLHPEDRPRVIERISHMLRSSGDDTWAMEFRAVIPSGRNRRMVWMQGLGRAERNSRGRVVRIAGINMDITERKQAELAERENQSRFRQIAESLPQLVWTCLPEGPCDYLSPQWVAYTGIPAGGQLGYGWLKALHADDRKSVVSRWRSTARRGAVFDMEFRIRRHDGAYRWFRTRAVPLRDERGRLVKWFGTNTDIHDLRAMVEALRESEQRLRAFLNNSAIVAWMKDERGRYVFLSDNFKRRFNARIEEWSTKTDFDLWPRKVALVFRRNDRAVLDSGKTLETIEAAIEPGGRETWWLASKFLVLDSAGRRHVGGLAVDVTERRKVAEELRRLNAGLERRVAERTAALTASNRQLRVEIARRARAEAAALKSEQRFRAFMENNPAPAWIKDSHGRFVYANRGFERALGASLADFRGETDFAIAPRALARKYRRDDRRVLRTNRPLTIMDQTRDADGGISNWRVFKFPLRDEAGGRLIGAVSVNVTAEERLQRELLRVADGERARIGQELHDGICQQLTAIRFKMAAAARRVSGRAGMGGLWTDVGGLVEDTLEQCRALARGIHPFLLRHDELAGALSEVAAMARRLYGVNCECRFTGQTAVCDPETVTHIHCIAQEAVRNAVKHGAATRIVLRLTARGGRIQLSVSDNGTGLRRHRGDVTGMGLRLMAYRARLIGGTFDIRRNRGGGTTVSLVSPAKTPARTHADHAPA